VLVVAELRLYREGLAELLDEGRSSGRRRVAGRCTGGSRRRRLRPDVALVDMALADNLLAIRAR
jgi:hypothetical protein